MKYVYWGLLSNPFESTSGIKESELQSAVNVYQSGFIHGLLENGINNLTVIGSEPLRGFPNETRIVQTKDNSTKYGDATFFEVGFLNIKFIRECIRCIKYGSLTKRIAKDEPTMVFIYSLYLPFLLLMNLFRLFSPNKIKFCLIVPDLPGRYGIVRSIFSFSGIYDRVSSRLILNMAKRSDRFVLLTDAMKHPMNIKAGYCVIEGFYSGNRTQLTAVSPVNTKNTVFLYAGSLMQVFGVSTLVDTFRRIVDPSLELWICGPVSESRDVVMAAKQDSRIKYLGFLSKKELSEVLSRVDILINPRNNIGEFVKYSFPSKTMEYLASGRPVLMFRLSGIPEEYNKYLHYIEDSLQEAIESIAKADKQRLSSLAAEAQQWLYEKKNCKAQVSKVLDVLATVW